MPRKRLTGGRAVRGFTVDNFSAGDAESSARARLIVQRHARRALIWRVNMREARRGRILRQLRPQ